MEANVLVFLVFCALAMVVIAFYAGRLSAKRKIVELSDVLKTGANTRSDKMIRQDAVMQLKNEIAESGALKCEKLGDGSMRVRIRVVAWGKNK